MVAGSKPAKEAKQRAEGGKKRASRDEDWGHPKVGPEEDSIRTGADKGRTGRNMGKIGIPTQGAPTHWA